MNSKIVITWTILLLPAILAVKNTTTGSDTKRILFYMGCGSYSMRISMWPLVEALTDKGHEVTFLSGIRSKDPNPKVSDFVPKQMEEWWESTEDEFDLFALRKEGALIPFWYSTPDFGVQVCEKLYSDPEAVEWIRKSKFDLIVIDSFMNECAYGLAHLYKAKTIVFSTNSVAPWNYDILGIPDGDTSWIADFIFYYPPFEPTFMSRVVAAVNPVVWTFIREYSYLPKLEEVTRKGLGKAADDMPSFSEMEKNTLITFLTQHYSQEYARSLPPNVIPIGGLALTGKNKPLPKEMEDFIKKGKSGFIYVSFGTVAEFSKLDKEVRDAFIEGLLQFPDIQFIWKAAKGVGRDLPGNFLITKWAPQQQLLAHPKIKAFVTHAGLGSMTEAIYNAVPLISFPIFAEQDYNANFLEPRGIGIKLEIIDLKSHHLQNAIVAITTNDKYGENMRKMSKLFKDRPLSALQTALWWTEFVIRHDSKEIIEFLHPRSVGQHWWVRRQLDVWLFVFLVASVCTVLPLYVVCWLIKKIFSGSSKINSSHTNKKIKQT